MPTITETHAITVTGADWDFVLAAVTDPHGLFAPGFAHAGYQQRQGLVPDGAILISDCAGFGADRQWALTVDGPTADTIPDPDHNGSWHVLTRDNLQWARWTSGSSGSVIDVERDGDDTWSVVGEFPVRDGQRYEGLYWDALQAALASAKEAVTT